MSTSPRPDQRSTTGGASASGSRSGAGDIAGALGYPGVPAAVPNCRGATIFQQGVGVVPMFTFPNAGRIWLVVLSYALTSNNSFSLATARTVTAVQTVTSGLTLAVVQLGVAGADQHAEGTCPVSLPGLPVVRGETVRLSVNNGASIAQLDQQASATMLYSIP